MFTLIFPLWREGKRGDDRKREKEKEMGREGGQSGKENHFRHDAWESGGSQIRHLQFDIKRKVASFTSKWKSTIGIEKYIIVQIVSEHHILEEIIVVIFSIPISKENSDVLK